ncbi:MAG: T9SS type A sorting domain-containing protein [Bacteroidia bacterium]|jgi:hypothetical protein|nr:T9SS type A sorting domain-containing protein [Bacteroidia bacterium]
MKKALLFLIAFIFTELSEAQNWCSPGAEWHYRINITLFPTMPGYADGYLKLNASGGDTIGGIVYYKLMGVFFGQTFGPGFPLTSFVHYNATLYEQNKVAYISFPGYATYDTLVNLNASIGDKWRVSRGDHSAGPCTQNVPRPFVTVVDTGHTVINGLSLKKVSVTLSSAPHYTETIIEKIGGTLGFLHLYYYCHVDQMSYGGFVCYSDNNFPLYQTPGYNLPCNFTTVGKDEFTLEGLELNVFPNPATEKVKIEFSGENSPQQVQLIVHDFLGREVLSQDCTSGLEINLTNLKEGLYTLSFVSETKVLAIRKLVISK